MKAVALVIGSVVAAGAFAGAQAASPRLAGGKGPVWSPDGTQLAYIAPTTLDHVAIVGSAGSGASHDAVTAPKGEILDEFRWGAAGRFVYSDSNYTLWSDTGTNGRSAKRIATLGVTSGAGESFALSRDGRDVVFTAPCDCGISQGNTVALVPVTGGRVRTLVRGKQTLAEYPSFSPDGKRVVFTRILAGRDAPAYPANVSLVVESVATGAQKVIHVYGQWAAYSPNGRWIAFFGTHGLEMIPAAGGAPRTLMPLHYVDGDASFSWSPDSQRIAYATRAHVGTVDLSGHVATFGTPGLRPNLNTPQWSPDGTTIAFSAIAKGADMDLRVYLINGDGSGLRRIA